MSDTPEKEKDVPIRVEIVSKKSTWTSLVSLVKDFTALTAFVGLFLAYVSPDPVFSDFVNHFKPIKENSNPNESEIVAPDAVKIETSVSVEGWSYLGNRNNEDKWYFKKGNGALLKYEDLEQGLILRPKYKMFVRVSPMTATNTKPETLGTVDPSERQCLKLEKFTLNGRTKSIWLFGIRKIC